MVLFKPGQEVEQVSAVLFDCVRLQSLLLCCVGREVVAEEFGCRPVAHCVGRVERWKRSGLAMPYLVATLSLALAALFMGVDVVEHQMTLPAFCFARRDDSQHEWVGRREVVFAGPFALQV